MKALNNAAPEAASARQPCVSKRRDLTREGIVSAAPARMTAIELPPPL
jgi:hypothetical protein